MASEVKTNKVSPASGTTITLGGSGNTVSLGSGATASGFLPSTISTSGDDFQFNSGYGSVATAYGCRAWANFNSTGTLTINESKNVSSITDNSAGNFDFNFSSSMPDANYAAVGNTNEPAGAPRILCVTGLGTNSFRIYLEDLGSSRADAEVICVAVFR